MSVHSTISIFMTRPKSDVLFLQFSSDAYLCTFQTEIPLRCIFVYFLETENDFVLSCFANGFSYFCISGIWKWHCPNFVLLTLPCGANTFVTDGSTLCERSFPALMTSSLVSTFGRLTAPFTHSCEFRYYHRKILQSLLSKSLWSTVSKKFLCFNEI